MSLYFENKIQFIVLFLPRGALSSIMLFICRTLTFSITLLQLLPIQQLQAKPSTHNERKKMQANIRASSASTRGIVLRNASETCYLNVGQLGQDPGMLGQDHAMSLLC